MVKKDRFWRGLEDLECGTFLPDWPVNVTITITWSALIMAGDHNEGHCLGKPAGERDTYLRREIARLARRESLPFVAIWGRDVGAVMGMS